MCTCIHCVCTYVRDSSFKLPERAGPAEMVQLLRFCWASFSEGKNLNQYIFTKSKNIINKSASVIFGLVRLNIYIKRCKIISRLHIVLQGILLCEKLSNKQSGSINFRPVRLVTLYSITMIEKRYQQ